MSLMDLYFWLLVLGVSLFFYVPFFIVYYHLTKNKDLGTGHNPYVAWFFAGACWGIVPAAIIYYWQAGVWY
jgi:hypothetical protein